MTDMLSREPNASWYKEEDSFGWDYVTIQNQGDTVVGVHINSTGDTPVTDAPYYEIPAGGEADFSGYTGWLHYRTPYGSAIGKILVIYS